MSQPSEKEPKTGEGMEQLSVIAVTNICNQSCIFCLDRDIHGVVNYSPEEALALIRKQAERGSDGVLFMGGEPGYRKDFLALLDECNRHGMQKMLATNGRVFADEARARPILERGINVIGMSLHSHDKVTANFIGGDRRVWDEQRAALQNLNRLSAEFSFILLFKVVLNRWNYRTLADTIQYTSELLPDVDNVQYQFKQLRERASEDNPGLSFGVAFAKARPYLHDAMALCAKGAPRLSVDSFDGMPMCLLGEAHAHMAREATDLVREQRYVGSEVRFGSYDHGIIYPGYEKGEVCGDCTLNLVCSGTWTGYLPYYGESALTPQTCAPEPILERALLTCHGDGPRPAGEEAPSAVVARLMEDIRKEQAAYRTRREDELEVAGAEPIPPEVLVRAERYRRGRARCYALLDQLAPEIELERPVVGGWFLLDAQYRPGEFALQFGDRKHVLDVRLRKPRRGRQPPLRLPGVDLAYRLSADADNERRLDMRRILQRLARTLSARSIQPFSG